MNFKTQKYFPDSILTSGRYFENLFKEKIKKNVNIRILGSNKFQDLNQLNFKKDNICLVLPEAILDECELLFNFTLDYLKKYNNLKFIWRLHPLMDIKNILKKLKLTEYDSNKIILSSNLNEDFEISKFCLYRGSTSVIQSIKYSVLPFYLEREDDFNIDPIYNLNLKNKISTVDDFHQTIIKDSKNLDIKSLCLKVEDYFDKPNKNLIGLI